MKPSVLITGGSGLLAVNWAALEYRRRRVCLGLHSRTIALDGVETVPVCLDSVDLVVRTLDEVAPQVVVHAAGLTSVETCEADPALAHQVNTEAAANVAQACARRGVSLVHISTDHLFAGTKAMVDENHPVAPLNVYAASKARGEEAVLAAHPAALVVRTNFYGWGPSYRPSFSDRIIQALRSGREINLFPDVHFTPILIKTLVTAIHDLVAAGARGIFNVVGDERLSKHAFGLALAQHGGLDARLITGRSILAQLSLVRRPLEMSLSNAKACQCLGRRLGSLADDLPQLFREEKTGDLQTLKRL